MATVRWTLTRYILRKQSPCGYYHNVITRDSVYSAIPTTRNQGMLIERFAYACLVAQFSAWWGGHHSAGDSSLRARLLHGTLAEASKSLLGFAGITAEEEATKEAAETATTAVGRMVKDVTSLNGLEPSVFAQLAALQEDMPGSVSEVNSTQRLEAGLAAVCWF